MWHRKKSISKNSMGGKKWDVTCARTKIQKCVPDTTISPNRNINKTNRKPKQPDLAETSPPELNRPRPPYSPFPGD
jgi:hypothetical protein